MRKAENAEIVSDIFRKTHVGFQNPLKSALPDSNEINAIIEFLDYNMIAKKKRIRRNSEMVQNQLNLSGALRDPNNRNYLTFAEGQNGNGILGEYRDILKDEIKKRRSGYGRFYD